jgi:hypothetical protein
MFLPKYQRASFTTIQKHRKNYSSPYSDFYDFSQQTRGQKVLDRIVASITGVQSPPESGFDLLQSFQNFKNSHTEENS